MTRADKYTGPFIYPSLQHTDYSKGCKPLTHLSMVHLSSIEGNDTGCANAQSKAIHKKATHAFLHSYLCGYTVTRRGVSALYVVCELLFLQLFPKALHRGWQNRALIYLNSALRVCSKVKVMIFKLHK